MHLAPLDLPADAHAVAPLPSGGWVAVGGTPDARRLVLPEGDVALPFRVDCPEVAALDGDTLVVVDARTDDEAPNAWVLGRDGAVRARFFVGDAVQQVLAVGDRILVTHFDEGFLDRLHGVLAFTPAGEVVFDLRELPGRPDLMDVYAACPVGRSRALVFPYTDFPLVEVDLDRHTLRSWPTPDVVRGAHAVAERGGVVWFHDPYRDRDGLYAWRPGEPEATRVGEVPGRLTGVAGGRFLVRGAEGWAVLDATGATP